MTGARPHVIGLTGSVGMGKTSTAQMFADEGAQVWDADAAVHRLYAPGGGAVRGISEMYPGAIVRGAVSRKALNDWISRDKTALAKIERVVHPLVAADRDEFLRNASAAIVVLDIPLLFESAHNENFDTIVVVSTSASQQRARVLARPGMTDRKFEMIRARQMPDEEKRTRADVVIPTDTLAGARAAVQELMGRIREQMKNA
ncbi:MAG: dephospho-CoA kinase [Paracoccaceae bacterium]